MKYVTCLAVVLVLLVCGCNNNDSNTNPADSPLRSKRIDLGTVSAQKIIGWSTALDRMALEQCFTYDVAISDAWNTDTSFGTARTSEAESQDLGVDASISLKYGLYSGSDTFSYVDDSDESALSVDMWFDASSTGSVEISNMQLNDTGKNAAEKGGAYFGLECGDKVFRELPLKMSTRFNINFRSSSSSNAQQISDQVAGSYGMSQINAAISADFNETDTTSSLELQVGIVGDTSLFLSKYLIKIDEDQCMDSGKCSSWAADLYNQFWNAQQNAYSQLKQEPGNFNTLYQLDYSKATTGDYLMDATSIPGVPPDTSDPYAGNRSVISNAVDVYADLLVAAKAMDNIAEQSSGAGAQTIDAVENYNMILANYASNLTTQINDCFLNPDQCNEITEDLSIFNLIENDPQLDADTQAALKASVQALVYNVYTAQSLLAVSPPEPLPFNAAQQLIYLTTFGPDNQGNNYKKVAATLNTIGPPGTPVMGAVFEPAQFVFDQDTLLGRSFSEPSYQYNMGVIGADNNSVHLNIFAGRIDGTEDFPFLKTPPQTIKMALETSKGFVEMGTTVSFTPRDDYLPTINPFYPTSAQ